MSNVNPTPLPDLNLHFDLKKWYNDSGMIRIKFNKTEDEIRGYYILATHGLVRSLRDGTFEICEDLAQVLHKENIRYETLSKTEGLNDAEALRNSLAIGLQ